MSATAHSTGFELQESVDQWTAAIGRMTYGSPGLETPSMPGLQVYWSNVRMPLYNHALLTSRPKSLADLEARLAPMLHFARERKRSWMFTSSLAWFPEGAESLLHSMGLTPIMPLTGMVAETLRPPRPNSAAAHEFLRLSGSEGSRLISQMNCEAYGMPSEWAEETDWSSFFGDDVFSFALMAENNPVSTATVLALDGRLNVVAVATLPEFQRKGYAEAVMRQALHRASEATGLSRTVLHASPAGFPIYQRMGYRPVSEFMAWAPEH